MTPILKAMWRAIAQTMWLELAGLTLIAVAAALVYPPAGIAVAGVALFVAAYVIDTRDKP